MGPQEFEGILANIANIDFKIRILLGVKVCIDLKPLYTYGIESSIIRGLDITEQIITCITVLFWASVLAKNNFKIPSSYLIFFTSGWKGTHGLLFKQTWHFYTKES